jgi:hypothetical protein
MLADGGNRQPELGPVDHARSPGLLVIRAEAADEENLRRIQDLLTARLEVVLQGRRSTTSGGAIC